MEKEKFLNIQNKLPNAIANMVQNIDDINMFFSSKTNPFWSDYTNAKKFLKDRIQKNIKILETSSTNDSEAKSEYLIAKQYELDFCLFCAYALELEKGETLFECFPPITDKISQFVYNHRFKNYEKYKKAFDYFTKEIKKNSIFVDDAKSIKNLINDKFGNAVLADEKMLIDKKLQNKLAYSIQKYPVSDTLISKDKDGFEYHKRYYVGEYKNKIVLFSEVLRITKKDKSKKDKKISYQLNIVLNGDIEKNRILYRMDYNFGTNHIDKMLSNKTLNMKDDVIDIDALRHRNVKNCHVHLPENRYVVIFPNYIHSCDAKNYDMTFKNVEKLLEFNRNLIKADDTILLTQTQKEDLKQNQNLKKIGINKFIKEILLKSKNSEL